MRAIVVCAVVFASTRAFAGEVPLQPLALDDAPEGQLVARAHGLAGFAQVELRATRLDGSHELASGILRVQLADGWHRLASDAELWLHGTSDPTWAEVFDLTYVRFTSEPIAGAPALVMRLGVHDKEYTFCSRRSATCRDHRRHLTRESDLDVFVVCVAGHDGAAPSCSPPVWVPAELVPAHPFVDGALALRPACARWQRSDLAVDCRYTFRRPD